MSHIHGGKGVSHLAAYEDIFQGIIDPSFLAIYPLLVLHCQVLDPQKRERERERERRELSMMLYLFELI